MRIPTYNHYLRQSQTLENNYSKIARYQAQISTGKKLLIGSDDPILASRLNQIETSISRIQSYKNNEVIASNRLSAMQSTMETSVGVLQKIQELIKSAQSDVLSNSDRQSIASQLSGNLTLLLAQANAKDSNGEYIFSGISTSTAPYSESGGKYTYNGAYENSRINISDNMSTLYSLVGGQVFGGIKEGNGLVTMRLDSGNTGSVQASNAKIPDQASYVEDTYTISFVTNSSGNLAYTVTGSTSGQVVPAPPATIPADAPDFTADSTISFNGIELDMSGEPAVGDNIVVAPSTQANIFDTIQNLITLLSSDVDTDADKANLHQLLEEYAGTVDSTLDNVLAYQTEVGSNYANTESQISINAQSITNLNVMLGGLGDADLYQVTTALTNETASLELTQKSYLQVQEVMRKLLDYLG